VREREREREREERLTAECSDGARIKRRERREIALLLANK